MLGLAVDRYVFANDEGVGDLCWEDHIARVAYEKAGGTGDIWFHFEVPPGRGMGFSAAARAAGAALAAAQRSASADEIQRQAFDIVLALEGHGDNAAPAAYGGIHIVVDDQCHRLATGFPGELLLWVPRENTTSTDESRSVLPTMVKRSDAVYSLARLGLLVASLYEQNIDLLHKATGDRLHQPTRFENQPATRVAYDAALEAGAAAAWLSGSGPTIGIVAHPGRSASVIAALPEDGDVLQVTTDLAGAIVVEDL